MLHSTLWWKHYRRRLADHLTLGRPTDRSRKPLHFEPLEPRLMLHGEGLPEHNLNDHVHHQLMVFIDGDRVDIPASIGVNSSGTILTNLHTHEADGRLHVHPISGSGAPDDFTTVGDFFDVWRTEAVAAGNNPNARFNEQQILGNFADATHVIRMFVNGELNDEFDDYQMHADDEIVIRYDSIENAGSAVFGSLTNPIVTFNTNFGPIPIELYANDTTGAEATPGTVDNFLNYINDGDFIDSIFHRLIPGFIVQGGGFITTKVAPTTSSDFVNNRVPTDPPIQNEFSNSNIRTTVAMAKLGGDPDSATSGWFVNLGDNSENLDNQNGGFTAFGRVLNMTAVEVIAGLTTTNAGGASTNLPHSGTLFAGGELVVVESIDGTADLHGVKFEDTNRNGIRDAGETGLGGFTIYIDDNNNGEFDDGEFFTVTAADGSYRLSAPLGTHTIREVQKPGVAQTAPAAPGSYTVVVGDAQIGRDLFDFDFGNVVDPPAGIDLVAASDSGTSDSDNLTRLNNASIADRLQFNVTGVTSGALVRVFASGVQIGQATAAGSTVTVTTTGSSTIADGFRSIVATQTVSGVESAASPALGVTIDSTADGFTNLPPTRVNLGDQYLHNVEHQEEIGDQLDYSLGDAPNGMTIDINTGQIIWTPTDLQIGPNSVDVQATDQAGNVGIQSFTIRVNAPPVIDAIDPVSIDEGSLLTVTTIATDPNLPNNDTLTFALEVNVPAGAVIDPATGVFTWTPTEAQGPGSFDVTVRVTDEGGLSDTVTFTIDVLEVNLPPILDGIASQIVEAGTLVMFTAAASDPDLPGGPLDFSLAPGAPAGAQIDPVSGEFTWTPDDQTTQVQMIGVVVTDPDGLSDNQTVEITVLVNERPTLAPIDPFTVFEEDELMFTADATDPNGDLDTLAFSLAPGAPAGATIDPFSGEFRWTPTEAQGPGTFDVTVLVKDALGLSGAEAFSVTVTEVNQPPVLEPITDRVVTEGNTVELTAVASDQDLPAQDIRFSLDPGAPVGATIDPESGLFRWTAPDGTEGTFAITVRATDAPNSPSSTTETFSVKVVADVSAFAFAEILARRTVSARPFFRPPAFFTGPLFSGPGSGVVSQIRSESLARQLAIRSAGAAQRSENIGSGRRWIMPGETDSAETGDNELRLDLDGNGQDFAPPIDGVRDDTNSDDQPGGAQAEASIHEPDFVEDPVFAEDGVDRAALEMAFAEAAS